MNKIIGNQRQRDFLKKISKQENIPHAFLFCGISQIGKSKIALDFSKSIICGCNECSLCKTIDNQTNPDLFFLSPEKNSIEIEKIRELQNFLRLKSYYGRKKIAIINDAHVLRMDAQNSLLKTLEEPPQNSILILVTSFSETLLGTIKSRVQRIDFAPIEKIEIRDYLIYLGSEKKEAEEITSFSSGKVGKAIELFEDKEKKEFFLNTVEKIKNLERESYEKRFEYIKDFYEDNEKTLEILDIFERYFRGIMLFKLFKKEKNIKKVKDFIERIQETKYYFTNTNTNKKLLLENLLINL